MNHSIFLFSLRATVPVMFGYVPIGIAFGVLFARLGYPWYYASLMSIVVYTGATQFMAVGLLAAGAGLAEIGLAALLLSTRHLFYGLSLAPRFPQAGTGRLYLIFGLTDETYSLLTATPPPAAANAFYLWVTGLNQFYWVLGSTVGALLGAGLDIELQGLDFVLTALFVVLTIEQARQIREARPFVIAALSGATALLLVGPAHILPVALLLATALLLAARGRPA